MIYLPPVGASVLLGSCRTMSYGRVLDFARNVRVPFRLALSQRVLAPGDAPRGVAALLAGEPVAFPRMRRDALLFAPSGCESALADCAARFELLDVGRGAHVHRCLWPFHWVCLRPVVGSRPPLSAPFFSAEERNYDLVLDLHPAGGDAFAWRGGLFVEPAPGLPDNLPFWVSCAGGVLAAEDLAQVCAAARGAW